MIGRAFRFTVPVAMLALALLAPHRATARPPDPEETFLAYLQGDRVGTWVMRTDARGYRETLRIAAVQDEGRTTVVESFELAADGAGRWRWERRVRAGTINRLERGTLADGRLWREGSGAAPVALATVPAGTLLPSLRRERIRAFTGGATAVPFPYLDPSRLDVVPARLEPCAIDATLPGATRCVALRLDARTGDEQWQLGADGRVLRIDAGFGGLPLRLERCERDCGKAVARPFDMIGTLVVASPYRIPKRLGAGKLRYVLVRADGLPPVLARTGEQAVVPDGARAVVTVCRDCGAAVEETPESLEPYLRANAWVRSDDVSIRRISRLSAPTRRSLPVRMNKLVHQVRIRMKEDADYLGYADAVQALRTGRGDCTEFAVLLAALARAQGIPSRVAVGMAYSSQFAGRRETFNPHAWVQVYDGHRWVSYDAALDGFDSTHLAFAVGTGEPQEVLDAFLQLRQLQIERLGAVVR
jgi:hypothetical protein